MDEISVPRNQLKCRVISLVRQLCEKLLILISLIAIPFINVTEYILIPFLYKNEGYKFGMGGRIFVVPVER